MKKPAFSNGAEYRYWRSSNCDECAKAWTPLSKDYMGECELEFLLEAGQPMTDKQLDTLRIGTGERCSLFQEQD